MAMERVVEGLYRVPLGISNGFLFDVPAENPSEGMTLVDTGVPGKEGPVLRAIAELGRVPQDLKRILLTHAHADHIGSVGALQRATGAEVYVHTADAPIVSAGRGFRPMQPAPGLKNQVIFRLVRIFFIRRTQQVEPAVVSGHLEDGTVLPVAGGLQVVHAPGHCAGQVALLWRRHGGVLIAADTCGHQGGLSLSIGYEDIEGGRRDLERIAAMPFEMACFGHGKEIRSGAAAKFRKCFGAQRA